MMNDELKAYINTTRFPRIENHDMDIYYNKIINIVKDKIQQHYSVKIDFHLVYSIQRNCEIITNNSVMKIIYDRYMGETLNLMTKVYMLPHQDDRSLFLSSKIYAETLRKKGRFLEVLPLSYSIYSYQKLGLLYRNDEFEEFYISSDRYNFENFTLDEMTKMERHKQDDKLIYKCNFSEIKTIVFISEMFILFHEVAHSLYIENKLDDYIKKYKVKCEEFFIREAKKFDHFENIIAQAEESEYNENINTKFKNEIIEEMLCDTFALEMTFSCVETDINFKTFFISIFITKLNLSWLKYLEMASLPIDERGATPKFSNRIRTYWIRNLFSELLENKTENKTTLITSSLQIAMQHNSVFLYKENLIMDLMDNPSSKEESLKYFGESVKNDFKTASIIIDSLLGWNNYTSNL